jgi:hypothetical protein
MVRQFLARSSATLLNGQWNRAVPGGPRHAAAADRLFCGGAGSPRAAIIGRASLSSPDSRNAILRRLGGRPDGSAGRQLHVAGGNPDRRRRPTLVTIDPGQGFVSSRDLPVTRPSARGARLGKEFAYAENPRVLRDPPEI